MFSPVEALLSLSKAPYSIHDQLIVYVLELLSEQSPEKIANLKNHILHILQNKNVSLNTMYNKQTVKSLLDAYYQRNPASDALFEFLRNREHYNNLMDVARDLFEQRGYDPDSDLIFYIEFSPPQERTPYNTLLNVRLACKSAAEAVLSAYMLETVLKENYGIPLRSSTKYYNINFYFIENVCHASFYYRREDYIRIPNEIKLTVKDSLLQSIFRNPLQDIYNYCSIKYEVRNTRIPPPCPPKPPIAEAFINNIRTAIISPGNVETANHSSSILVVTRTGLGFGNYINARVTLEKLCQKMPNLKIFWIIATDGDTLPTTKKLPHQITPYITDTLWKIFPLIQALSLEADLVINLPNQFLIHIEERLNTLMSFTRLPNVVISEYNTNLEVPSHHLHLRSGINAGPDSLGLVKPLLLDCPESLDEKRRLLCQDEKARKIFDRDPLAPFYFAYAYHPSAHLPKPIGITVIDSLALFIQHAKLAGHCSIKVAISITPELINEACKKYPGVFHDCFIQLTDNNSTTFVQQGNRLLVNIYNLFPYSNTTFRLLMDYAASNNTPVVVTGDQSFMELFFTTSPGLMFIYQVLNHKQPLIDEIRSLALQHELVCLSYLLESTVQGISSEPALFGLANFLLTNQEQLKLESLKIAQIIKMQPDLVDSLTRVLQICLPQNNIGLGQREERSLGDAASSRFMPHTASKCPSS